MMLKIVHNNNNNNDEGKRSGPRYQARLTATLADPACATVLYQLLFVTSILSARCQHRLYAKYGADMAIFVTELRPGSV
jgi:hypothetical protein